MPTLSLSLSHALAPQATMPFHPLPIHTSTIAYLGLGMGRGNGSSSGTSSADVTPVLRLVTGLGDAVAPAPAAASPPAGLRVQHRDDNIRHYIQHIYYVYR